MGWIISWQMLNCTKGFQNQMKIKLIIYNQGLSWHLESKLSCLAQGRTSRTQDPALIWGVFLQHGSICIYCLLLFSTQEVHNLTVVCWAPRQLRCFLLTWWLSIHDLFVCFLNWVVGFPVLRNMTDCFPQWQNFPKTVQAFLSNLRGLFAYEHLYNIVKSCCKDEADTKLTENPFVKFFIAMCVCVCVKPLLNFEQQCTILLTLHTMLYL